ncbi:glycosyltransferase family 2 protein [Desulfococcaceae bacterium HSG9]|nr:glycosyltransferase family 2 protein [Desulfococcaceae bacterium HSG9]
MNPENIILDDISIFCIIVTHNPQKTAFEKTLNAIFTQAPDHLISEIVVVDNDSDPQFIAWLKVQNKCEIIEMGFNSGVGAAQNRGISWAIGRGASHVLLMDQDSVPSKNMVANLILASLKLERYRDQSVVVGPRIFDPRIGKDFPFVRFGYWFIKRDVCLKGTGNQYQKTDFLIASGMLIPVSVLKQAGLMDETLFIDNVDLEWGFRARQYGVRLYGVCNAVLEHHLGDKVVEIELGKGVRIYQHSPLRQYYMMRNRIILYKKSYSPSAWIIQDFVRMILKLIFVVLFFPDRSANIVMIYKGIRDGFCRIRNFEFGMPNPDK